MFKKVALFLAITLSINTFQSVSNKSYAASVYSEKVLIRAVQDNDYGLTRYLLRVGVDVNTYSDTGSTPLIIAVENNNIKMTELLLSYGADVNDIDQYGNNAYCYGIASKNKDMQSLLKSNGARNHGGCNKGYAINDKAKNKSSYSLKSTGLTVLTLGVVAVAAGGGGGGGSSSENTSTNDIELTAEDFETDEYSRAKLNLVNASSMYVEGYTGKYTSGDFNGESVKVAVIDSGTDIDHVSLVGNISSELTDTNLTDGGDDPSPTDPMNFHGTHVAGIIAATKDGVDMHGIAYEAEIIPYKVATADEEYISTTAATTALNDIVTKNANFAINGKSKIVAINNSYGSPTLDDDGDQLDDISGDKVFFDASDIDSIGLTDLINGGAISEDYVNAIKNVLESGTIMVWAAGNDYDADVGKIANEVTLDAGVVRGFTDPGNEDLVEFAVVAIAANSDGTDIADYSNRCGVMKDYCLMVPGTGIISTTPNDTYGSADGTSMAAPMITGAIALIKGAAPNLTGDEILDILFETATDMGAVGVDEIYGNGMMNLQAALSPIGNLAVASVSSNSVQHSNLSLNSSKISTTSSLGDVLSKLNQKIITLDSYERSYETNIADLTSIEEKANAISYLNSFMNFDELRTEKVKIDKYTSLSLTQASLVSSKEIDESLYRFNFSLNHKLKNTKDKSVLMYYLQDNDLLISNNTNPLNEDFISKTKNPYISFIDNIDGFIEESDENQITNTGFGFNFSKNFNVVLNNNKISKEISANNIQNFTNQTILTNLKHSFKSTEMSFTNGITKENDTVLGSYFGGAFDGIEESITNFHGLSLNYKISNRINLFGNYMIGFTNTESSNTNSDLLLSSVSNIRSDTFGFGVVYKNQKTSKEFGLKISQPLRINEGNMTFVLPQNRNYDNDTITSNTYRISMTPSGREIDIESYYKFNIFKNLETKLGLMHILDKNHDSNSRVETIGMVGLKKAF